ncbi:MAG: ABC transporter transmembrane domain-containing protein [Candidatus Omnitrophota bacterium]|nr:ABC transporter transmembrane domain-containing protein [Candidatus Omnitrophota bacterium]
MKGYFKDYFKLLRLIESYRKLFALAFVCIGVSSIFNGVTLGMIVPLVDRIMSNKKIIIPLSLPPFLVSIVDRLNSTPPMTLLVTLPIFAIVLFLIKGLFIFLQGYLMNKIAQGVVRDVKDKLYAKFQDLSLDFYAKKRTGELISRITNDVNFIANALSYALTDLIFESMQIIVFGIVAFSIGFAMSWKLFLVFLLFPAIFFPISKIGKRIKKFSREIQNKMADLNSLLTETIQGAYIVKVFCREGYELQRFKEINQQYYRFTMKSIKRTLALSPLTEFIGVVGAMAIMVVAGREVILGKVSFGVFGLFMASFMSMLSPFKKLSNVYAINQQAIPASERIYDILEEESKIKDVASATELKEFKENIEYRGVWFKYEESDGHVLKDVHLKVRKGEVVALVGHSGAGKSTMVSLLPRLYDPEQGEVYVDGIDLRKMKLQSLRSLIAVVSQEMVLFNATVRDNIAYGKKDASEEEIIEAAKKAYAYDFVNSFPKKFDTVIGDRGFRLSGGERQRIAIARAVLKDAPILILDEATSQLDSESERLVKEAFYNLMEGKTVFVIAHRLSTVQKADRIVVIEKGQIVETGTHTELLSANTLYKKLYDLQFNV